MRSFRTGERRDQPATAGASLGIGHLRLVAAGASMASISQRRR
jgi:hypothetical protein